VTKVLPANNTPIMAATAPAAAASPSFIIADDRARRR
jgi:hypothetical protein